MPRLTLAVGTLLTLVAAQAAVLVPARAQEGPAGVDIQEMPVLNAPPPQQRPDGKEAPAKEAQAAKGAGDSDLRQRVEQLEEQLVDLQVVIGTLESLAKAPPTGQSASSAYDSAGPVGAGDVARLDGIETQIRALTSQLEQLSDQVRAMSGQPPRGDASGPQGAETRFGTVNSSNATDPIGKMLSDDPGAPPAGWNQSPRPEGPAPIPGQMAAADPAQGAPAENSKQIYENAYASMLQRDYAAAQAGFSDLLKRFPKDPLVPNALYWLGESYYMQRNFADAAEAFDIVTSAYAASQKAPDSQLKRAMALSQLGKTTEACAEFRVLGSKFPNAPAYVKSKGDSERKRLGCT
jgi:tol-pal system protein YbgF